MNKTEHIALLRHSLLVGFALTGMLVGLAISVLIPTVLVGTVLPFDPEVSYTLGLAASFPFGVAYLHFIVHMR